MQKEHDVRYSLILLPLAFCIVVAVARAQSSSLYGMPTQRPPLSLQNSWFYQQLDPPKQIQINDQITVLVKESQQMTSDAEVDRRKRSNYDARLQDWIIFKNGNLKPDPQSDGDPRIRAQVNSQLRSEMGMQRDDSMQFRITATVVDIRPNGNLVIEAHRKLQNNEELWEASLSGIVRREDVTPANTVLSEKIAELSIYKREKGHVQDATMRGWFIKVLDSVSPF